MGWEKPLGNYKIIVFTRDQILIDALAEFFGRMEGVSIINLLHMDEPLAVKYIDSYSIDIAFIEEESVGSVPVRKIIEKVSENLRGARTHFILRYDDQCAVKMINFGESMLAKKLPITQFRLDDKEDIGILLQTIYSLLIRREQQEKRQIERLKQELSGLLDSAREQFFKAKRCFEEDEKDGGEQVMCWLTMSAEGGHAGAAEALASIYLEGKIAYPNGKAKWPAPKDTQRAAHYLEWLVERGFSEPWRAGHPNALWVLRDAPETLLARMHLTGEGVAKDIGRGLWLHHLASIGLSYEDVSMKELGVMYLRGAEGIARDIEKAAYWMLKYDIRSDRPACSAEYLREHFLQAVDGSILGHLELREVREQDAEAFVRGLNAYLDDENERNWYLWSQKQSSHNNEYDRGHGEEGNNVLATPNPYETLRKDRKKAEEYFVQLWSEYPNGEEGV